MHKPDEHNWIYDLTNSIAIAGAVSVMLHPIDKAIFESMINHTPFLRSSNFKNPWSGVGLTAATKPITGCTYLFTRTELNKHLYPYLIQQGINASAANLIIGISCGVVDGFIKTPFNAIKTHTWSHPSAGVFMSTKMMYGVNGYKAFLYGMWPTIQRDAVFGAIYEPTRCKLRNAVENNKDNLYPPVASTLKFGADAIAAGFATISSGVFNYVRIKQQSCPLSEKPGSFAKILRTLAKEITAQKSIGKKFKYTMVTLGAGPGTVRVIIDLPLKQFLFSTTPTAFNFFRDEYKRRKETKNTIIPDADISPITKVKNR